MARVTFLRTFYVLFMWVLNMSNNLSAAGYFWPNGEGGGEAGGKGRGSPNAVLKGELAVMKSSALASPSAAWAPLPG